MQRRPVRMPEVVQCPGQPQIDHALRPERERDGNTPGGRAGQRVIRNQLVLTSQAVTAPSRRTSPDRIHGKQKRCRQEGPATGRLMSRRKDICRNDETKRFTVPKFDGGINRRTPCGSVARVAGSFERHRGRRCDPSAGPVCFVFQAKRRGKRAWSV